MNRLVLLLAALLYLLPSHAPAQSVWTLDKLKQRSIDNQDPKKWNAELLNRDIANQKKNLFGPLPLTKGAFPVADYDYYVASTPFTIATDRHSISGISVGENTAEQKKTYYLSIFVLADKGAETKSNDLTLSRNYPYFTAEGFFESNQQRFDWVTVQSPDGFSFALVNMKLFDLRFGQTIFIIPQKDNSFRYYQLELDPNKYQDYERFKQAVLAHKNIKPLL